VKYALLGLCLLAACTDKPRCGPGAMRLELRDAAGVLTARLAESARKGELDLCDPAGQRLAAIGAQGGALVLYDRGNAEVLRAASQDATDLRSPAGQALRLYKEDHMLRVLKPDGVPYGTLHEKDAVVLVSDPAGSPRARISRRDADAVAADPDGAVKAFFVPAPGLLGAGVLTLEELPLPERVFLAVLLGPRRLQP
jgi:hypothetical protein